jgi:hypothetical protein
MSFKPKKGDVIFVDRGLYKHYGVYCGRNRVVHFAPKKGFELDADNALIQETTVENFLKEGILKIDTETKAIYSPDEIVKRACSLLGKQKGEYNLIFNNCEHFARWCVSGKKQSLQVETGIKVTAGIAAVLTAIGIGISAIIKRGKSK